MFKKINTTIYIKRDLVNKLDVVAGQLNISKSELVSMLIRVVKKNNKNAIKLYNSVKYQKKDKDWHRLHVSFLPHIYEYGLDMRKLFKQSVSFIVAGAIDEYLEEIVKDYLKTGICNEFTDNYMSSYTFLEKNCDGIRCFTTFWGMPEKKNLKKYL